MKLEYHPIPDREQRLCFCGKRATVAVVQGDVLEPMCPKCFEFVKLVEQDYENRKEKTS